LDFVTQGVKHPLFESLAPQEVGIIKTRAPADVLIVVLALFEKIELVWTGVWMAKLDKPRPRGFGGNFGETFIPPLPHPRVVHAEEFEEDFQILRPAIRIFRRFKKSTQND
jgi:hypothetical protein